METYVIDYLPEMDAYVAIPMLADTSDMLTLPGDDEYSARMFAMRNGITLIN